MINEQALKDRLKIIAKEKNIPFNSCWKQFILERILARVECSSYAHHIIFKGGFLLAYIMRIGRETVDLDFLLTQENAEMETLEKISKEIASISLKDGFTFSLVNVKELSQPHMDYPGYRITFSVLFGKMKNKIHLDIGVGDVVKPQRRSIQLFQHKGVPFFEDTISLLTYPIESIFAEKLETVVSKGSGNSRMKDFHDILLLVRSQLLRDPKTLKTTLQKTFKNRQTPLSLIEFESGGIEKLQKLWLAHLKGLDDIAEELALPKHIKIVIDEVNSRMQLFISSPS